MIDRLREQIQHRLEQVLSETERLRGALAALDPRSSPSRGRGRRSVSPSPKTDGPSTSPTPPAAQSAVAPASSPPARAAAPKSSPPRRASTGPVRAPASAAKTPSRRSAPGATRAAVLTALAGGEPKSAAQVASAAGLARGTVSATLSKLVASGEVERNPSGYQLTGPRPKDATPPARRARRPAPGGRAAGVSTPSAETVPGPQGEKGSAGP